MLLDGMNAFLYRGGSTAPYAADTEGATFQHREVPQDDRDDLPNRWADTDGAVYVMPGLGWRYG